MREQGRLMQKIVTVCLVHYGILFAAMLLAERMGYSSNSVEVLAMCFPFTFVLAGVLGLICRRALLRVAAAGAKSDRPATQEAPRPRKEEPPRPSPDAAVQILSALQREGRLVDFLQEELGAYEDAQIGAAVRNIHEGCRKALTEHVGLQPVYEREEEGAKVTVAPGFDARAIRLTGNVQGDPPFRGVLRHKGWRVVRMDLPVQAVDPGDKTWILSPAEVEIE